MTCLPVQNYQIHLYILAVIRYSAFNLYMIWALLYMFEHVCCLLKTIPTSISTVPYQRKSSSGVTCAVNLPIVSEEGTKGRLSNLLLLLLLLNHPMQKTGNKKKKLLVWQAVWRCSRVLGDGSCEHRCVYVYVCVCLCVCVYVCVYVLSAWFRVCSLLVILNSTKNNPPPPRTPVTDLPFSIYFLSLEGRERERICFWVYVWERERETAGWFGQNRRKRVDDTKKHFLRVTDTGKMNKYG